MPPVTAFKGFRYGRRKEISLSRVVSPPYDVISPEGQERFYSRHPYNFIRIVFGKERKGDDSRNNRYLRARRTLQRWVRAGILKVDSEPGIYPYQQEYSLGGKRHSRWGVIALVRLDSPAIYPHEETREGPKQDRLQLLRTVRASLSPILGLIPDSGGSYRHFVQQACKNRPVGAALLDGVRHRLWRVTEGLWIERLKGLLWDRELIIADGHHRFEAALRFRDEENKKLGRTDLEVPTNYAMFYLASVGEEEPGLLPTHRVLRGLSSDEMRRFRRNLETKTALHRVRDVRAAAWQVNLWAKKGRVAVGFYCGNGGGYVLKGPSQEAGGMDVEWLHNEIFPRWMRGSPQIAYTQDLRQAEEAVHQGQAQAVFVMQPPRLKEVFRRARSRARMPGKTTYFYPKPLDGLVEYKFEGS